MRRLFLLLVWCFSVLLCVGLLGEGVVRLLQVKGYLPDYSVSKEMTDQEKEIASHFARFRFVDDPRLYIELDPDDPAVNSWGFRGPEPEVNKKENVYRIAVIGDSVAFGYGLPMEKAFPALLESSLRSSGKDVEVLNFSVSGYGLEAYRALYESKVRQFHPDLVLLAYVLNDYTETSAVFTAFSKIMQKEARVQGMARISQFSAWFYLTAEKAIANVLSNIMWHRFYASEELRDVLSGHFKSIQQMAGEDQAKLFVVVFPLFTDFHSYGLQDVHESIGGILSGLGIQHHDLLNEYQSFDAVTLRLAPGDFTHPNERGQKLAQEFIEAGLYANGLLPAAVFDRGSSGDSGE